MRLLTSLILLLLGVAIYALFRDEVLFLLPLKEYLPAPISLQSGLWSGILVYNLPDALWFASLLLLQTNPFASEPRGNVITIVALALPFALEGLQAAKIIPGTFDWLDILFYMITLLIFIIKWKKENDYLQAASSSLVV